MGIKSRLLNTYHIRKKILNEENTKIQEFLHTMQVLELEDGEFTAHFGQSEFMCIIHDRFYHRKVIHDFTDNMLYSCFVVELFNSVIYTYKMHNGPIIKNIYGFGRDLRIKYELEFVRYGFYKHALIKLDNRGDYYSRDYYKEVKEFHTEVEGALEKFGYYTMPGLTVAKMLKYVEMHIADNIQVEIENNGIVKGTINCNTYDGARSFGLAPMDIYYSYNTNKILDANDIRLHKYNENLEVLKELSEWGSIFQ